MTLPIALFGMFSPTELLVILGIVLILFGGKKLPDLAHSLGRSMGEFKKGLDEGNKLADAPVKEVVAEIKSEEPPKVEGPKA